RRPIGTGQFPRRKTRAVARDDRHRMQLPTRRRHGPCRRHRPHRIATPATRPRRPPTLLTPSCRRFAALFRRLNLSANALTVGAYRATPVMPQRTAATGLLALTSSGSTRDANTG